MNKEQNAALEAERVAFEAAYIDVRGCLSADVLVQLRRGDDYADTDGERLNIAWRVWQQARAQLAALAGVSDGWRVTKPTGAGVRKTDRWEIYGPEGGGVVHTADVTDLVVRQLLDALAAAPSPAPASDVVPVPRELPPFAQKVIGKLERFEECASDSDAGGVDIGRHWLDLLTQLGLLNRVQRSPALWEISQQGEDLLNGGRV